MTIKKLMIKLNQTCSKNIGKVIYTLFLLTLLESLCSLIFILPAVKIFSAAQEQQILQSKIIFFALLFVALTVWLAFQFGFAIMLLQMTRNENANLGFLFIGFRRFNPAGKVILSFAAIISAAGFVTRFITKALYSTLWPVFSPFFTENSAEIAQNAAESALKAAEGAEIAGQTASGTQNSILSFPLEDSASIFFESGLFLGIFLFIALVILIRFAFVFHLHFDKPSLKIPELFKESFKMMKGNVFRLIALALRAGGKNLLFAIAFALIVSFIPDEKSGLSILSFLFDLAYFINLYTALVKIYFSVPVLYEAIRTKDDDKNVDENENPAENLSKNASLETDFQKSDSSNSDSRINEN